MGERKGSVWWIRKVGWRASRKLTAELLLTDKWRAQKTGGESILPRMRVIIFSQRCSSFSSPFFFLSPSLSLSLFSPRFQESWYVTKRDFYLRVYYRPRFFNERKSSFPPIFPLFLLWRTHVFQADFQILRHLRSKISFGNEIKRTRRSTSRFRVKRVRLHRSTHEEVPFEDFPQGRLPSIISSPRLYSGRLSTSRAAFRFSRVSHALFVISIR